MFGCTLKPVRADSKHVVYTEHTDHINPDALSTWLSTRYGEAHIKISLRRSIYVIYIDQEKVAKEEYNSIAGETTVDFNKPANQPEEDWQRELRDRKLAEKILSRLMMQEVIQPGLQF
ncbi:hypothetical protein F5Y16DRAFT_374971 [Xylariaceae sp. FL0255]|nr:hypothetical protein F5Y16DRAFT_374971 [Xylariaceae sp. FL0255]